MLFAQATGPLEVWPRTGPLNVEPKSDYGRDSITFPPIYVPENEKSVWDVLSTILELELQSRVKYKIAWQEDNLDYVLHNGRIGLANLADAVDYVWKHRLHGIAAPSKAWYIPPRDEDFLKGIYRDPAEDYTAEAILHRGHADSKVDNCELCAKGVGV
ncbi:uncharacterized protein RHO25_005561 [Cercospora beticola]|uniref:Uncharacterized protein n=1 Tax=Cercospora beticola TaxID=122368 RepID=A0ABZ0NN76_CERBT|nr:hypothetical protein RHO25_005561 [Cercospora beticola]